MSDVHVVRVDEAVSARPVATLALVHHAAFAACFDDVRTRTGLEISPWVDVSFSGEQLEALIESLAKLEEQLRREPASWMVRVFETGQATLPDFVGVDGANGELRLHRADAEAIVRALIAAATEARDLGKQLVFAGE